VLYLDLHPGERVTCALAWATAIAAWVPMLGVLRRAGVLFGRGLRGTRPLGREPAFALVFGVLAMMAALVLVAANGC
jgi:hypothetical protein